LIFTSGLLPAQKVFYAESVSGWDTLNQRNDEDPEYSLFLIGDVKYPSKDPAVVDLLRYHLLQGGENSSVVFLGDIVYPKGLPDDDEPGYQNAMDDLKAILSRMNDYDGNVFFISGNHDWERGREQGWERVQNEEKKIEEWMARENIYLPDGGCPGPVDIQISNDVVLIILNSQWFFHNYRKPGPEEGCDFEDENGIFIAIEDAIRRYQGKHIVFATHHPLMSAGNHGGHFPASRLLFPLLDIHDNFYIPLPGFIYTGYRKYLGHVQDIAHPVYQSFRQQLLQLFNQYPNVIYAAGHEHNLQFKAMDSIFHIVSGGGGEGTYIARNENKADFAMQSRGMAALRFYADGDAWIEFYVPNGTREGRLVFRKVLYQKSAALPSQNENIESVSFSDSSVTISLNNFYEARNFRRFWMGNNYRKLWSQEVTFPVFNIGSEKGGLTILKRGGGQQTRSVRLEDPRGKQYVLRSVNKYVEKALDPELRNTIAEDAVQDGISASNPFGALTVPKMADAVGVFHTNPKLVWVPDDLRLGIYQRDLANDVFLFEERPDDDRSDIPSFGRSEKIRSTSKMIEKLREEQDHRIDQKSVVRARLFDMLINDWDRHDDQWRWASFKEGDFRIYKPIPRDRDQVYFVNEGVIMWLASRDFIMPKFQGFDYTINNVKGLGFNARYFDRSFMSEPDLNDWLQIAGDIKQSLTDSIIHEAIKEFPPEIYTLEGTDTEAKLKARRNQIEKYAEEYYRYLSRTVDVIGTDDRDLFEVQRKENGNTAVKVSAISDKKGKRKFVMYSREFKPDETREIRLYGLKDNDNFYITGNGKKGIKIRVIGGKNNDTIVDDSHVAGWGRKTLVYDRKDKENHFVKGPETKMKLLSDPSVNLYDRKQFKYNKTLPLIGGGYNIDDGVFVSGGVQFSRFNFRDSTIQKLKANLAFATQAFGIEYEGVFSSVSQHFDLVVDAALSMPRNVDNFFGIGNETKLEVADKSYYRVRYEYADVNLLLRKKLSRNFNVLVGLFYQYFKVNDTANRFIGNQVVNLLDTLAYRDHHFGGLSIAAELDTRDDQVIPQRGIYWKTTLAGFWGADTEARDFGKLRTDLRFYLSFRTDPRMVLVLRFGGAANLGAYEFYHANFLGRKTNLRGFRSNRFAGDQSLYQNTELRFKLFNLRNYLFNGQAGVLAFNDIGRVWVAGENSTRWHDGYGFGVWLTPFNALVLTANYNISIEEKTFTFTFNFLF
jgi:hypothetical protein